MVASIIAGYDIDFARCIIAGIHERVFRRLTTMPFPCLIYRLCRDFGEPIIPGDDQLIESQGFKMSGWLRTTQIQSLKNVPRSLRLYCQSCCQAVETAEMQLFQTVLHLLWSLLRLSRSLPHVLLLAYHIHNKRALSTISVEVLQNLVQHHT